MAMFTLNPLPNFNAYPGPLVFIIMDGVGLGARDESDGIFLANTPVLDAMMQSPLYTQLKAHGTAVGQPADDDMGNSEVGHNTMGAGRVFAQGAKLCNEAIASKRLFEGKAWKTIQERSSAGGTFHLIGLLSDGYVHSHINQLLAMLDHAAAQNIPRIRLHLLTDGRDVAPKSALGFLDTLDAKLVECNRDGRDYRIASGGGRMNLTMDRYGADWPMIERGWNTHVLGEGRTFATMREAIETYYAEDAKVTDQHLGEFVITENDTPIGTIEDGDAAILFNFRGDRAIELCQAFEDDDFPHFDRKRRPDMFFAGMMQYDGDLHIPKHFLVEPTQIGGSISEYICGAGLPCFAISETQKYGHVTYFWNGNKSGFVDESLEKYVEISSDNMTFDKRPWMKAGEITDTLLEAIAGGEYKFIRANYPNADMVGHTGHPAAVRVSVEAVDLGLERLAAAVEKAQGILVVTADHGNADLLFTEKDGERTAHVAHTLNPVPFVVNDYTDANEYALQSVENAGLSNIAATLINLLGYAQPEGYDASLVRLA